MYIHRLLLRITGAEVNDDNLWVGTLIIICNNKGSDKILPWMYFNFHQRFMVPSKGSHNPDEQFVTRSRSEIRSSTRSSVTTIYLIFQLMLSSSVFVVKINVPAGRTTKLGKRETCFPLFCLSVLVVHAVFICARASSPRKSNWILLVNNALISAEKLWLLRKTIDTVVAILDTI